jgi:ATP-binding cassette subfamily B protein
MVLYFGTNLPMQTDELAKLKIKHTLWLGCVLHLVWQSGPSWTIVNVSLLVIQGVLLLLLLYLMKLVVDGVTTGLAAPQKEAAFGHIVILIGLMGGVALASALCRSIGRLVSEAQTQYYR